MLIKLLKRSLGLLMVALLTLVSFANPAASLGIGSVDVHVIMLRNGHGQVICTLFNPSDQFPDKSHKGMTIAVPIQGNQATCAFKHVPYGDYAIVAFHDENRDGEFNQNWLGMPKEGFGFSNNPGTLKKPVFSDARFTVDQPVVHITIRLNYWP